MGREVLSNATGFPRVRFTVSGVGSFEGLDSFTGFCMGYLA